MSRHCSEKNYFHRHRHQRVSDLACSHHLERSIFRPEALHPPEFEPQ